MVRVRSNLKKKLRRRFIILILLVNVLFISYFLLRNTSDISNQTIVKEINIGADNEKRAVTE
jgi:lipopolysaccharide export system protein LptC